MTQPLSSDELQRIDARWRAANYLSVGSRRGVEQDRRAEHDAEGARGFTDGGLGAGGWTGKSISAPPSSTAGGTRA